MLRSVEYLNTIIGCAIDGGVTNHYAASNSQDLCDIHRFPCRPSIQCRRSPYQRLMTRRRTQDWASQRLVFGDAPRKEHAKGKKASGRLLCYYMRPQPEKLLRTQDTPPTIEKPGTERQSHIPSNNLQVLSYRTEATNSVAGQRPIVLGGTTNSSVRSVLFEYCAFCAAKRTIVAHGRFTLVLPSFTSLVPLSTVPNASMALSASSSHVNVRRYLIK
ncbi:hypothetical protein EDD85DRAFT_935775 [Armillaria nabsnona]|nr:hypothetical protein EDD85DRAFT_935775 [Armillaria nabsnona]